MGNISREAGEKAQPSPDQERLWFEVKLGTDRRLGSFVVSAVNEDNALTKLLKRLEEENPRGLPSVWDVSGSDSQHSNELMKHIEAFLEPAEGFPEVSLLNNGRESLYASLLGQSAAYEVIFNPSNFAAGPVKPQHK